MLWAHVGIQSILQLDLELDHRKDEGYTRTFIEIARCPHIATMPLNDGARGRQAQPAARDRTHARILAAIHSIEDALDLIIADTNALVGHAAI